MRALLLLVVGCGGPAAPASPPPSAPQRVAPPPDAAMSPTDATLAQTKGEPSDEPVRPQIRCESLADAAAQIAPALADSAPERAWSLEVRKTIIVHECDHGWSDELRYCVYTAKAPPQIDACITEGLPATERDELTQELTEVGTLADKIAAARRKPESIGCKQVVDAHYGDAMWKGKLEGFAAADRKKMIATSRQRMTKACTADRSPSAEAGGWNETLRACVVVGGGQTCFESFRLSLAWGYPAAGTATSLGPDCDAYGAELAKIAACGKVPADSREALRRSFQEMKARMASLPAAERAKLASGCRAGREAVRAIAAGAGC